MITPALLAVLALASARAEVALVWAPAIDAALPQVEGAGKEVTKGFDAAVLKGLEVRYNEIQVLGELGVKDLDGLKAFLSAGEAGSRLHDLARSLELLAPVIRRLEADGAGVDDFARPSSELAPLLSRALADVARATDSRARELAARYEGPAADADEALADAKEADAIMRDGYPYLSIGVYDALAQIYDAKRSETLAARLEPSEPEALAVVEPGERETLVDAVADRPVAPAKRKGFWSRLFGK